MLSASTTLPLYSTLASLPPMLTVMVNETLSPSTFPFSTVDLPKLLLVVSPVSLSPSTLKMKVRSIVPLGLSALPFQLPPMSAADAVSANTAIRASSHFINDAPPFQTIVLHFRAVRVCLLPRQYAGRFTAHRATAGPLVRSL